MDAVQRAAYRFSDRFTVEIVRDGDALTCRLFPRDGVRDIDERVHDFRAEVLDQVLRSRIRAETEQVRNLILAVAFSNAGIAPSNDGVQP
jgi:His-Xaa-Ser system protein HxsD